MASASKVDIWNRAMRLVGETDEIELETEDRPAALVLNGCYDDLLREMLEARVWPWAIRQSPLVEISEQTRSYSGDDATTQFSIPFGAPYAGVVSVEIDDVATTAYTFTAAVDDIDPFVTMTVAPATGQTLVITVTTERAGWAYVYSLPNDCVTPTALLYGDARQSLLPTASRVPFAVMPNDSVDDLILCCDVGGEDLDALEYVAAIDYVPLMPSHFVTALACRLAVELATSLKKDRAEADYWRGMYAIALDQAFVQASNVGRDDEAMTPSIMARG